MDPNTSTVKTSDQIEESLEEMSSYQCDDDANAPSTSDELLLTIKNDSYEYETTIEVVPDIDFDKLHYTYEEERKVAEDGQEDFYTVKKMTIEELEAARDLDRNVQRYKLCTYKCDKCILGYFNEALYLKHVEDRHSESSGEYVCSICDQRFPTSICLENHHSGHFYGYECKLCQYTHNKYSQMDVHYNKMHKADKYTCKECEMRFPSYRRLRYHRETSHKMLPQCDTCGRKCKTKSILKRHILIHTGKAPAKYKCQICSKTFANTRLHKEHMSMHTPDDVQSSVNECEKCGLVFNSSLALNNHIRFSQRHNDPTAGRLECDKCNRQFRNKTALHRHNINMHTERTDLVCHYCKKWFKRPDRLNQHVKFVHQGVEKIKDKICTLCGKAFSERRILLGHMRVHTGEKPFHCSYCNSSFTQKGTMTTHIRTLHADLLKKSKEN